VGEKEKEKEREGQGLRGAGASVMCFVGDLGLETNWGFGND